MKKVISVLLVLVMLLGTCSNAFADGSLTPEEVTEECLAYYDTNKEAIMAALKDAAGDFAAMLDYFDVRGVLAGYLDVNAPAVCLYLEEICGSPAGREEKTANIADYLTNSLIALFNMMMPGAGGMLAENIRAFADSYAPTIVEQYKEQLNLATIVSDNPMFFFIFSLAELIAIVGLIVALAKSKKAAK